MSNVLRKVALLAAAIALPALVAWGVLAARQNQRARHAATGITEYLNRNWPENEAPQPGTREVLMLASSRMEEGDWVSAAAELASVESVTPEQRAAANRFFVKQAEPRQLYVSAVNAARAAEQEGADVEAVRVALKRALLAASRDDRSSVESHLATAHAVLESLAYDETGWTTAPAIETVAELLSQVGPSFLAGRELLLESHAGVVKLMRRARYYYERGDYARTQALTRLALDLSGIDPSTADAGEVPDWFDALEPATPAPATRQSAESAVGLCESMAAAAEPSEPVDRLVRNAKRELAAERFDEANWWAGVALNALGIPDETTPLEPHD